jgi:rhodanese-related sulfurtransferase
MKEIGAREAFDLMQKDPQWIYLDVRSLPEFEQGHPLNAVNIPILHLDQRIGMYPNDDFVSVVVSNFPKDAKLVIGCKTGARSARACEILSQVGYQNVINVRGGFLGVIDPFGRVVQPGWSLLSLPVCQKCEEPAKYETLSAKATKPKND